VQLGGASRGGWVLCFFDFTQRSDFVYLILLFALLFAFYYLKRVQFNEIWNELYCNKPSAYKNII